MRSSPEHTPLLSTSQNSSKDAEYLSISLDDPSNPRSWPRRTKYLNTFIIALMALLSPLASSAFAPGIDKMAQDLHTDVQSVIWVQSGFAFMLGIGPLIFAPLSETVGRRNLYIVGFSVFTIMQIACALAPNIATLIVFRVVAGFFGSVGVANGGGSLSDMYDPAERSHIFGWYLMAPLLGPTLGPIIASVLLDKFDFRALFWCLAILSGFNTLMAFIFLRETYLPAILSKRAKQMEEKTGRKYTYEDADDRPLRSRIGRSIYRPLKILTTQPIVMSMSLVQALFFSTTYSLYTNMQAIYGGQYGFSTTQVGLSYLGPGIGFFASVRILVPRIDTVFNALTEKNGGVSKPEYRLPMANVGICITPFALAAFGWLVQIHVPWYYTFIPSALYGFAVVVVFNSIQNYYLDAFHRYGASAIAAGSLFRSIVGSIVPPYVPQLFDKVGYGWGFTVFAAVAVVLAPAPILFMRYGEYLRERFKVRL